MKTTMGMQNIANPRRTTLAHLEDADELATQPAEEAQDAAELPASTANPRRTTLMDAPAS
ncbi:hypothetical protein [Streptomyces sp. ODS28]|uniref:hypothetical protein n=1 Tax=Streptomyces sp. ODS28 TaxID=3136688 RepID=UPI0031EE142B